MRINVVSEPGRVPQSMPGELGDFLRSRREKLDPVSLKLPSARRRRTPGLRREEVAALAGIGVDWYIRLEQGRSVRPSPATVSALGRALQLNKAEQAHLVALTRKPESGSQRWIFHPEVVPTTLRRVVENQNAPAYLTGRRWDVLAWSPAADRIFGFSRIPPTERNVLLGMLTRAEMRELFGQSWAQEAQRMVSEFRAVFDLWATDPSFIGLVEQLQQSSPEFSAWWRTHDVSRVASGRKSMLLQQGHRSFEYTSFQSNDDQGLKLVIYAEP
jgi:transcriptional regulator with XRE-family HTH domain